MIIPPNTAAQRLRAIARDLAKQHNPKGERIDAAVRQLGALAEDIDAGIEGGADGA
jgi:hypothetical protein